MAERIQWTRVDDRQVTDLGAFVRLVNQRLERWADLMNPLLTGGGGGGAPTTSSYVTVSAEAGLSAERRLVAGSGISLTDGGANSTLTIAATGASTTASGSATLDFGGSVTVETDTASVAVADAGIGAGSEVVVSLSYVATADHTADEVMISNVQVMAGNISAGVGFTITGYCPDMTWGKYTVHWVRN